MSNTVPNKHIKILDIAKGFSIILVTLVHYPFIYSKIAYPTYPNLNFFVNDFVTFFRVPVFIFISGCLISESLSFKNFLYNKIDGLIKPVIGFLIIITILNMSLHIITSHEDIMYSAIKHIKAFILVFIKGDFGFVNYALWFIGPLFWGLIALKCGIVIFGLKNLAKYVCLIFFVLLLLILSNTGFQFYYLEYTSIFSTYLILGFFFKKLSVRNLGGFSFLYSKLMIVFPILFLALWLILFNFNYETKLDLYNYVYNYHILLILSILGIFTLLYICSYIEKVPLLNMALVNCSKASYFILAFHVFIIDVYKHLFDMVNYNPLLHLFLFMLNIALCYTIYKTLIQIPYIRILFFPLKRIELFEGEIRLLKSKPISRLIPKEILILN